MNLFNDHKKLFWASSALFVLLMLFVAIMPAINNQLNNAPLPGSMLMTADEEAGKKIYISEGCVGCHSQQVRNVEMDKVWGSRPGIAADYAGMHRISFWQNTATLMGTERTGPDLTNIGQRQPSKEWHLLHLFNPRAVVAESIMPSYAWLFEDKDLADSLDVIITVPEKFKAGRKSVIVASQEALQLVAYLKSLSQIPLPDGTAKPEFLYQTSKKEGETAPAADNGPDGAALYASNCQSCHQPTGEGLKGAFPPLKGSEIVLNENPQDLVNIIMNGYDAREEYAVMPAVGKNNNLKPQEIAAIMNHERTSWGNNAKKVTAQEVEKFLAAIQKQNAVQ